MRDFVPGRSVYIPLRQTRGDNTNEVEAFLDLHRFQVDRELPGFYFEPEGWEVVVPEGDCGDMVTFTVRMVGQKIGLNVSIFRQHIDHSVTQIYR